MQRNFGLDLLRCIAIVGVVVAHIAGGRLIYCFTAVVPVELFFSLSGFLIAQMIVERFDGIRSPAAFWVFMANRWLRTIPLYLLALVASLAVLVAFAPQPIDAAPVAARYALFLQYIPWYHDNEAWQPTFFTVSWSLAIEEWFYLLCPMLLLVARGWPERFFCRLAMGLVVASIAYRLIACLADPAVTQSVIFKSPLTRADAFVFGIGAYFVVRHGVSGRISLACLIAGLTLAAINAALIPSVELSLYTKVLTPSLAPLSMALLIPASLQLRAPKALAGATAWLSTRTYAIYLFHSLVIAFIFPPGLQTIPRLLLCLVAIGLLADFLYRYIERPFMRMRPMRAPVPAPAE